MALFTISYRNERSIKLRVKINLQKIRIDSIEHHIYLVQDNGIYVAILNTALNHPVHQMGGIALSGGERLISEEGPCLMKLINVLIMKLFLLLSVVHNTIFVPKTPCFKLLL